MFKFLKKKPDNANYLIGAVLLIVLIGFIVINKTGENPELQGKITKQTAPQNIQPTKPVNKPDLKNGINGKSPEEELKSAIEIIEEIAPNTQELKDMAEKLQGLNIIAGLKEKKENTKTEFITDICIEYGIAYGGDDTVQKQEGTEKCEEFFESMEDNMARNLTRIILSNLSENLGTIINTWNPEDRGIKNKIINTIEAADYDWGKIAETIIEAAGQASLKVGTVRNTIQNNENIQTKKAELKTAIQQGLGIDFSEELENIHYYMSVAYVNLWIDESKFLKEFIRNRFPNETKYPTTQLDTFISILEDLKLNPDQAIDAIKDKGAPYIAGQQILNLYEDLLKLENHRRELNDLNSILKTYGASQEVNTQDSKSIQKLSIVANTKLKKAQNQLNKTTDYINNPDSEGIITELLKTTGSVKPQIITEYTAKAQSYMTQTSRNLKDAKAAVNNFVKAKIAEDIGTEYTRQQTETESSL